MTYQISRGPAQAGDLKIKGGKSVMQVAGATFTIGADVADVVNVAIQLTDAFGNDLAVAACLPFYLSSDAAGQVISAAHDGGMAIGTDGLMQEFTANVAGLLTSEADGDIDIDMTDTGAFTCYLNLVLPNGTLATSTVITHDA